ncbi:Protein kinase superfamily protein [Perilla frutescens var. hirtella]|nr:Protein kinase superfamily protein [Perilla frutescens var. frutescens]KAH6800179.1 Protein kinase superfamily protein [Perilla frutescens var. hirtella]
MGCGQSARHSMNSPPHQLERMKMKSGYVNGTRRKFRQDPAAELKRIEPRNGKPISGNEIESHAVNGKASFGERKSVSNSNDGGEKVQEVEVVVDGWPKWLTDNIPREVLKDIVPKSSDSYIKIDKIGQGTYSNVYKARDRKTGKIVALKKVRFDTSEAESVKFMAREIMILQRLDHPNIVKLQGLATSRMQYSIYLVFDYMQSDLSKILSRQDERLTEPQIKCYMQQLLSGLQHCHERGILHRDIKASNLLIDKNGMLKIADFGLGNFLDPESKRPLTSRVVTLWYRAPELLLGSTDYGTGIDLWSTGCLMAEMFAARPILPGRTEVEQVHIIFKLCGTPPDDFFRRMKLSTALKPPQTYKSSLAEKCRNFPSSAVSLLNILLALEPSLRGSASSALDSEFFQTSPLACDLSGLPVIHVDDDEVVINSTRKHRTNRARRRSRAQRGSSKKNHETEKAKGDDQGNEEVQKSSEASIFGSGHETISTRTTSASSSAGAAHEMSSRSEAHPNAAKNITNHPPLPTAKLRTINYDLDRVSADRLDLIQRSASSRELRSLENSD